MASTTSLYSSPLPSLEHFLSRARARIPSTRIYAEGREARNYRKLGGSGSGSGRVVDENLIVLRKRIQEMKMSESGYEFPSQWSEWEKRAYASYEPIICDAVGQLQSYLMETPPSLALAMFVLIALSVPTSTAVVVYHLLELTKAVLNSIH